MNLDAIEPVGIPGTPAPRRLSASRARMALFVCVAAAVGAFAVIAGHRRADVAVVNLGPTDGQYAHGFRDLEQDGGVFFRWSVVPSSAIEAPVRFCGPGALRLRVRRHFLDPALLSVSLNGTELGQRSIRALGETPYHVITFPVTTVLCSSDIQVLLETSVENSRPLGVAVDWMEIRADSGFSPGGASTLRGALALAIAALCLGLAGAAPGLIGGLGICLAAVIGLGFAFDPVAGERMLRGGLAALVLTAIFALAISHLSGVFRSPSRVRVALAALTLAVLVSRSIFLIPQVFYPDYRVHALVLQTLDSLGLPRFLGELFDIQYARSLGLQQIDGNWYPFPYPPGSYLVAESVSTAFGLDSLDALAAVGVAASSLIPLGTFVAASFLGVAQLPALAGAFFMALQPLLVRRLALGYFPGVTGQLSDLLALVLLLSVLRQSPRSAPRLWLLGLALLAAFLIYTQAIANFGLLTVGLLLAQGLRPRVGGFRAAATIALVAAGALGAATGVFYARYVPVLENIRLGQPQPESTALDRLDAIRRANPAMRGIADEGSTDDPYAGPTFNPARGLARLASRLWLFNGVFALAIPLGLWLLWRQSDDLARHVTIGWGGVCIWISVLAAGLPSPNGFQHLKDLEFVAPLLGIGLGLVMERLWTYRPFLGIAFAAAWAAWTSSVFLREVLDRLLPTIDR